MHALGLAVIELAESQRDLYDPVLVGHGRTLLDMGRIGRAKRDHIARATSWRSITLGSGTLGSGASAQRAASRSSGCSMSSVTVIG